MKKIISICLIVTLLSCLFTGCKKQEEEKEQTTNSYTFTVGEVSIAIDAQATPILESIGAYKNYAESPSCAFEGMDKVYTYDDFEIETYCLDGIDYIASVRLVNDSVKTQEGITIGSKKEDVISAYGDPTEETASALIYSATGMKLQFLFRDGMVYDVQYLKVS